MKSLAFETDSLVDICHQNGVLMLGVFGSHARGEANEQSDIDLLVKFSKPKSLLALIGLERQFSDALGTKVDLLTEASLSPHLRARILHDLRVIYGEG